MMINSQENSYVPFFPFFIVVIAAVTGLTFFDKFTPSLGVLFGSLVGYIYGKNQS